jgi:hypothetical protein
MFLRSQPYRFSGIPTQVVVPSVSFAAVLHGFAGTIFVETPSSAGLDKPVDGVAPSAETPWTATGAFGGGDWPVSGGEEGIPMPAGLGFPTPV